MNFLKPTHTFLRNSRVARTACFAKDASVETHQEQKCREGKTTQLSTGEDWSSQVQVVAETHMGLRGTWRKRLKARQDQVAGLGRNQLGGWKS